jgi:four helix bundle protein
MAMGSASEVEYQLLLSHDLEYTDSATHTQLDAKVTEVKRMLSSLIHRVRAAPRPERPDRPLAPGN